MRTVRRKLLFIVLVSLVPMLAASAIFSRGLEQEQERDLETSLHDVKARVDAQLDDDIADLEVAVRLLGASAPIASSTVAGDAEDVRNRIRHFSDVYGNKMIIVTDTAGHVLASSMRKEAPIQLVDGIPGFRDVVAGRSELVKTGPVPWRTGEMAYIVAGPLRASATDKPAGAVIAAFPVNQQWMSATGAKLGLALSVALPDGSVIRTSDAPLPRPELPSDRAGTYESPSGKTVATIAFEPRPLTRARVYASTDISESINDNRRFMIYRLAATLAVAILAAVIAMRIASRMTASVDRLSAVMPSIADRTFKPAEVIQTGDELQRLAETYNAMVSQLTEGEFFRRALGKYLSRAALEQVKKGELKLGGSLLPATVLFADIRDFTTLAERMDPVQLLGILNQYFTEMVAAVMTHGGIVDKFIGDAIMAVWGPPHPAPDDAVNAVRAAVEMRARLAKLNMQFAACGLQPIRIGIGIHSGDVVAGNMGAEGTDTLAGKMEYTVIGDAVNVASRLESLTKTLHVEVLLSEDTHRLLSSDCVCEAVDKVQVKGRQQPIEVYKLVSVGESTSTAPTIQKSA